MLSIETLYDFKIPGDKIRFEKRLNQKLVTLERHLVKDSHPNMLRVKTETINNAQTRVSLQLYLKYKNILADKTSDDPVKALELAFDVIKESLLQHLSQYRGAIPHKKRRRSTEELAELYQFIIQQEKPMVKEEFTEKLLPLLDDLRTYIRRRIRFAQLIGTIKPQTVSPKDIVNEVVVKAYDQLMKKEASLSLEQWLYDLADREMNRQLREDKWLAVHTQSWEDLVDEEINELEEHLVVDAQGEPALLDQLDDYVDTNSNPNIPEVMAKQDTVGRSKLFKRILKALAKVEPLQRDIFELYALDNFTPMEIANIKHLKKQVVERIIEEVRNEVRTQLQG